MHLIRTCIFVVMALLYLAPLSHAAELIATVNANSLKVYSRMSRTSSVVRYLEQGKTVIVEWVHEDMESKWCGIHEPGEYYTLGYVECRYLKGSSPAQSSELRSANLRSYSEVTVVLYSTSWCRYCREARAMLKKMGVSLVEYDIEKDRERAREMRSKGGSGVPFVDVEGIYIRGYAPVQIKQAVEQARGG